MEHNFGKRFPASLCLQVWDQLEGSSGHRVPDWGSDTALPLSSAAFPSPRPSRRARTAIDRSGFSARPALSPAMRSLAAAPPVERPTAPPTACTPRCLSQSRRL
uniref:EH domain-containing protein n=1 Tax=Steinernema glaseri TaxID=37863 RepID=A0A1I8ASU9_9BILA